MKTLRLFPLLFLFGLFGCAELMQLAETALDEDQPLTQNEIISGLKEALIVGTSNSTTLLGKKDGYYKDDLVKILLPTSKILGITHLPNSAKVWGR